MVKLDVSMLRYLTKEDFRTLVAVEMGMKNHELVPTELICSIAKLKRGGAYKCLQLLLKHKLLQHDNKKYDGYKLNYSGYDYLALRALTARGSVHSVGNQIGVGKEADVYIAMGRRTQQQQPTATMNDEDDDQEEDEDDDDDDDDDDEEEEEEENDNSDNDFGDNDGEEDLISVAIKFHRLGRTSFRAVKNLRDYHKNRTSVSWLYLSRLGAMKEYAFMQVLYKNGFPVPEPIDWNRHLVVMQKLPAVPLSQVRELRDPAAVFSRCMEVIVRLGLCGLVHCDFNEFNILVSEEDDTKIYFIDFPQMVSTSHKNADTLFDRDVECLKRYFARRFSFVSDSFPTFEKDVRLASSINNSSNNSNSGSGNNANKDFPRLDVEVHASGFTKEIATILDEELYEGGDEEQEKQKEEAEVEKVVAEQEAEEEKPEQVQEQVQELGEEDKIKTKQQQARLKVRSQSNKTNHNGISNGSRNKGKNRDNQKLKNEITSSVQW